MPNRTKKDHKRNNQSGGSHWQNFHFSGKLIVCSVIFGLMLILIGGIVMAIGMDRDEDTKSDDYEDLQKKPPMAIVGPVIMGIGGFTVFVGVSMCLVETNVCRRRNVENSPLIEEEGRSKDSAATGVESDPTAIPSTSHKHRNGNHRKSPSPRKSKISAKKPYSTKDRNHDAASSRSPSSAPIAVAGQSSKSYLSASDKFLTPPSSFAHEMHPNSRDAENQTSSSLMKSFTSSGNSWTVSTEFQTPNASSIENSMPLESSLMKERLAGMLDPNSSIINSHEFLTPKNSNAEMMISKLQNPDNPTKIISETSISVGISGSNVSVSNEKEFKQEIKGQPISFSEVLVTASVEEEEFENQDNEYHSSDSSEKDVEGSLPINESGEGNKSPVEAADDMPNSTEITENKDKAPAYGAEASLNPVSEKDLKDDNLVKKVQDQRDDNIETSNTFTDEDKSKSCYTEEAVSKESDHIAEEGSQSNGENTNQETDISQKKSPKENLESQQKIMESESVNDITDSERKSSLNKDET